MRNEGLVNSDEPFTRLLTQGMVLKDGSKMSKSKGNTVDPLGLVEKYGADTVRMFVMFASPPDQTLEWSDSGVEGSYRFLKRLWKIVARHQAVEVGTLNGEALNETQQQIRFKTHSTLQKVNDDYKRRHTFNTAIAATMELLNTIQKFIAPEQTTVDRRIIQEALESAILMLAPVVPHFSHVLWQHLGHEGAVMDVRFPQADASALIQNSILIVLQVNGKLRARIEVDKNIDKQALEDLALAHPSVQKYTEGKEVRKVIIVPGKLVNIVV
jgi:leucyl-tRNA synthetase